MQARSLIFFVALFVALDCKPAMATIPIKFSIGAGIAIKNNLRKNNLYKANSNQFIINPIPLIQFSWGPIFLGQQGLTASFYGNKDKSLYINLNRVGERFDGVNMDSRRPSWFTGIGMKYTKFNFMISRDIDGKSHGMKTNFSYTEVYIIKEKFFTRSSIGLEYLDQKFADYYYGVRSSEVRFDRREYHPKFALNPIISFFPGYKYNDKITFLVGTAFKYLHSNLIDSPTSNGDHLEASLISGLLWQF